MALYLSMVGFEAAHVRTPLEQLETTVSQSITKVVLITTDHPVAQEETISIHRWSTTRGKRCVVRRITNIFDFYEVYETGYEYLHHPQERRFINLTAGPGVANGALTVLGLQFPTTLVSWDQELRHLTLVDPKAALTYMNRTQADSYLLNYLREVGSEGVSYQDIMEQLRLSRAAVSRRVRRLRAGGLVEAHGTWGRSGESLRVRLAEVTKRLMGLKFSKTETDTSP